MNSNTVPALALVVAIAIFFGYVKPAWTGSIAETKTAIANKDEALAAASQYLERQSQLASAKAAIDERDLARVKTLLPDSVDNVNLILDLNALAARSGLALSNIDVISDGSAAPVSARGAVPSGGTNVVGSVDLALSAVGTYASLQAFLKGVERSGRLLDVRDLVVKGSSTGAYAYQMTLRLYWLR